MRVEIIKLYQFDELNDAAKEKAREWYRTDHVWDWHDEWWDSAVAFSAIAPVNVDGMEWYNVCSEMSWTGDDALRKISGVRAWKWLQNNGWFDLAAKNVVNGFTLTGYGSDNGFFDPIEKYQRDPAGVPDLETLFRACVYSWASAARRDMEWFYSDDCVDDMLVNGEYEFTSRGVLWG